MPMRPDILMINVKSYFCLKSIGVWIHRFRCIPFTILDFIQQINFILHLLRRCVVGYHINDVPDQFFRSRSASYPFKLNLCSVSAAPSLSLAPSSHVRYKISSSISILAFAVASTCFRIDVPPICTIPMVRALHLLLLSTPLSILHCSGIHATW